MRLFAGLRRDARILPRWIETSGELRVAVMECPPGGSALPGAARRLAGDGVEHVVSLLEAEEAEHLGLAEEGARLAEHGITLHRHPIPDHGVPASTEEVTSFVRTLRPALAAGAGVVVHCRAGLGRAPLMAACLLAQCGEPPRGILRAIGRARGTTVPETVEQARWIVDYFARMPAVDGP